MAQDPYGLSKIVGETIADSFIRLAPIAIASLRLAGVNFDPPTSATSSAGAARGAAGQLLELRRRARCGGGLSPGPGGPADGARDLQRLRAEEPDARANGDLLQRCVPDLPRIKDGFSGNFSGMDPAKAARVLGFHTEHLMEHVVGPDGKPLR